MKRWLTHATIAFALFASGTVACAVQAAGNPTGSSTLGVSKDVVFWTTFWVMTIVLALVFLFLAIGLVRSRDWYLGDAVSEEAGNQPNPLPSGVKPVMVASSSRLIALIGLLAVLGVFVGFGYYFLYAAFASTLNVQEMKNVLYYLSGGALLFAPYLANQLREAFTSFAPSQTAPMQPPQALVKPAGAGVG